MKASTRAAGGLLSNRRNNVTIVAGVKLLIFTIVSILVTGLLAAIMEGKIDTTFLISHRMPLERAPDGYKMFHDNQNEVTKVVLKPGMDTETAIAAE